MRRYTHLTLAIVALALASVGCGSMMTTPDAGGTAGGSALVGGGSAGGSAAGGSAAGGSAAGGSATLMATSTITLNQREVPGNFPSSFSSTITARFASGPASADPCVITTSANCTTTVCTSDGGLSQPVVTLSSAGTLSIAGTLVDGGISLMPGTTGTSTGAYSTRLNTQLWAGGETLTLSATGAVVPAFSQTVVAPLDIVVTAPSCPRTNLTNNCGTLSRSTPLTVSWTGGGSSTVEVDLTVNDSANLRAGSISCLFPASAGTGVIPTAVLSVVPAGQGFITIEPTGRTSFAAGAWMVSVIASGQGVRGLVMVQ